MAYGALCECCSLTSFCRRSVSRPFFPFLPNLSYLINTLTWGCCKSGARKRMAGASKVACHPSLSRRNETTFCTTTKNPYRPAPLASQFCTSNFANRTYAVKPSCTIGMYGGGGCCKMNHFATSPHFMQRSTAFALERF